MTDILIKELEKDDGTEAVRIVRRSDGVFSYQKVWRRPDGDEVGLYAGLYDSAETAEREARDRIPWLVSQFH
ncbi:MAG TPA: hypothetical protein VGL66_06440 [Caulobacteraceae bacterium]